MEWSLTRVTYIVVTSLLCVLQIYVLLTDAKPLANYSIPGEQCDSGFIISTGDQYEVHLAETVTVGGKAVPRYLSGDIDCTLKFRADRDERFLLRIVHFQLEQSVLCENDSLSLLDGLEEDSKSLTKNGYPLCGNTLSLPNYFSSSGNGVTVRFRSDGGVSTDGLRMFVTPFTKAIDENCEEDKFLCVAHDKCITKDAYCNGARQCEDGYDEPDPAVCASGGDILTSRLPGSFLVVLTALLMTVSFR